MHATLDPASVALARAVVAACRPDEMPLFEQLAHLPRAGSAHGGTRLGGTVGFGLDDALFSEVALQVAATVVVEASAVGTGALLGRLARWRKRPPAPEPRHLVATPEGAAAIRTAARRQAMALGLSEDDAGLLADAVVGALAADTPR